MVFNNQIIRVLGFSRYKTLQTLTEGQVWEKTLLQSPSIVSQNHAWCGRRLKVDGPLQVNKQISARFGPSSRYIYIYIS